jgi:GH24 family phage-related lysozyme (muramidase)
MASINPTNNTSLIIDEFIQYATTHLQTVSGVINTISLYPPIPTPGPGVVNWTGYTVPPATVISNAVANRILLNEILNTPLSNDVELETDPVINAEANANRAENSGFRADASAGGFDPDDTDFVVVNITSTPVIPGNLIYTNLGSVINTGAGIEEEDLGGGPRPTYTSQGSGGGSGGGGGGSGGSGAGSGFEGTSTVAAFGKLSVKTGGLTTSAGLTREQYLKQKVLNKEGGLDIRNVDLSKDWVEISARYMITRETFKATPTFDVNKNRLGYGTDQIWDVGASEPRDVKPGDVTTEAQARKTLYWQIQGDFKNAVVGSGDLKLTQTEWDALNDTQKAALVIYCYNNGSFKFATGIPKAIKAKDYIAAANAILNGPITGGNVVYPGLIKRRAEEAGMFAYGL